MSDTNKQNPPTTTAPFIFNKEVALLKLEEVKQFYLQFAGKQSYNPFFFIAEHIEPKFKKLSDKKFVATKELWDEIMNMPKDDKLVFLEKVEKIHQEESKQMELAKKLPPPALPERPAPSK